MDQTTLHVVILAAGKGKRMHSSLPKVMHLLGGIPLLQHVVATSQQLNAKIHVIYGHSGDQVLKSLPDLNVNWIEQAERLGTGHAVMQALPFINHNDRVLILVGDTPLISVATLNKLLTVTPLDGIGIVTVSMPDPTGLGRILRDANGNVSGIVEEKDASEIQRQIKEVNTSIMLAPASGLAKWLPALNNHNAQGEFYLTDMIAMAVAANAPIVTVTAASTQEVQGINDRQQLARLERYYQQQCAERLLLGGVTLLDPNRFDLRGQIETGDDVTIDVNVVLEGQIILGSQVTIGPNCLLRNVRIGDHVQIKANCIIEDAEIDNNCVVGPFARIRPETKLAAHAHIGNFVEIKKSTVGKHSKINHLSYIGDATIGADVNVGAGTITCNYDGVNKFQTVIEDNVFIGSDTQLIAPVVVRTGATIGAGSTITKEVPSNTLTLSRAKQLTVPRWQRPVKKTDK